MFCFIKQDLASFFFNNGFLFLLQLHGEQQSKVKLSVRDLGCATYQKLLLHDLVQFFLPFLLSLIGLDFKTDWKFMKKIQLDTDGFQCLLTTHSRKISSLRLSKSSQVSKGKLINIWKKIVQLFFKRPKSHKPSYVLRFLSK